MFVIAQYHSSDYEQVWELHQKTISENGGFVKNLEFHTDFQNISKIYEAFFVARKDDQVVGMVGLKRMNESTLEIKRLQVASAYQGQGLGRMLMGRVMHYAKACKTQRLRLDVSEPQSKARALYTSMGFKITHVQEQILGSDHERFLSTFMEKNLDDDQKSH